ncbi:MAG: CRISPR-associated endonuclease Cas3'', partial [Gammaproteobacteria bacterium]|nr:CRISPR-associated endonuclease Cas3'' [Gammaproteobacteria bacterium]
MDKQVYVAHVKRDENGNWDKSHCLEEHLQEVGEMAKQFAGNFGSDWAQLAGLWHDLGKYRKRFQDYIRLKSGFESENAHIENGVRAPHSTAGAIHAVKNLPPGIGHVLAYIIAGHHAGLPDWIGGRGSLSFRLTDGQAEFEEAMKEDIPKNILASGCPEIPSFLNSPDVMPLWIRMLFSCLVDADFLDTERYMQADKFAKRERPPTVSEIKTRFAENMKVLQLNASTSPLVKIRDSILQACNDAAELEPGIFSLTVPTGGGKTLSSLAFALKHAEKYKKKRIIYAIPFTSIIEQNADVFRAFVGEDAVLEHHSNLDFDPKLETNKSRLAAENWDASLIVTTNVQLFESLHASRTSRCRKLHNLVNSVIILDEAQQIPRDFHSPITRVMQQLSDYFGVTWLLCTATQPVLEDSKNAFGQLVFKGLGKVREIIHNPSQLAKELKRVDVELPKPDDAVMTWEEVAKLARSHECVLVIVNTRKQAKQLYELLNDDDALHLSANMCAQHRTEVINAIKHR